MTWILGLSLGIASSSMIDINVLLRITAILEQNLILVIIIVVLLMILIIVLMRRMLNPLIG